MQTAAAEPRSAGKSAARVAEYAGCAVLAELLLTPKPELVDRRNCGAHRDMNLQTFLASGRAAVESSALIPGGESVFVVTVPAPAEVGRYRVSFRSDDRVISHVDKRNRS